MSGIEEYSTLSEPERLDVLLEATRSSDYMRLESLRGRARATALKRLADETGRRIVICGEAVN